MAKTDGTHYGASKSWPYVGSWTDLATYLSKSDANERGTRFLRRLARDTFKKLRDAIEDPDLADISWESPGLVQYFEYPLEAPKEANDFRALFEILTAGATVVKKEGSAEPLIPTSVVETLEAFSETEQKIYFKRWIDGAQWTKPVAYGELTCQENATIIGYGTECTFKASPGVLVYPRLINLDIGRQKDSIEVGLAWKGHPSPDDWTPEEVKAFWRCTIALLDFLTDSSEERQRRSGGRVIAKVSPRTRLARFDRFEALMKDSRGRTFSEKMSFEVDNTPIGSVPAYVRGAEGPIVNITDGAGNLKPDAEAVVFAAMAHPDSEKRVNELIAANRFEMFLKLGRSVVDEFTTKDVPAAEIWQFYRDRYLDYFGLSLSMFEARQQAPSFDTLRKKAAASSSGGRIAAELLQLMLHLDNHLPAEVSLNKAVHVLSSDRKERANHFDEQVAHGHSVIYREWAKFKPVSHLWAAYWHWQDSGDQEWALVPNNMHRFLSLAEGYRRRGEKCYSRGQKARNGPILDPTKTFRVPQDLQLLSVSFDSVPVPSSSDPVPEWILECLASYSAKSSRDDG